MNQSLAAAARETRRQTLGGIALIGSAVLALVWSNSPLAGAYQSMIHLEIIKEIAIFVFFLSVGIELRHEIKHGSMRNPRQAVVPIFAAMGGMALPVIIYSLFNAGQPSEAGWGIPMSTDIAFALAIYAIVGRGLPKALRANNFDDRDFLRQQLQRAVDCFTCRCGLRFVHAGRRKARAKTGAVCGIWCAANLCAFLSRR